jgi:hypothetical protein
MHFLPPAFVFCLDHSLDPEESSWLSGKPSIPFEFAAKVFLFYSAWTLR